MLNIDISKLSGAELHIYNYVLSNPLEVTYCSIQELAQKTNTSTASILRFCHKSNCDGFSEYKLKLRQLLDASNSFIQKPIPPNLSDMIVFFEKVANSPSFQNNLNEAANLLYDKDCIVFIGSDSSRSVCDYGELYFSNLNYLSIVAHNRSNTQNVLLPGVIKESTGVVIVSSSGETSKVIDTATSRSIVSCPKVLITNTPGSTLDLLADVVICNPLPKVYDGIINLTSITPSIFTIEQLAIKMSKLKNQK